LPTGSSPEFNEKSMVSKLKIDDIFCRPIVLFQNGKENNQNKRKTESFISDIVQFGFDDVVVKITWRKSG
jgi:hypothetical protein